MFEEYTFEQIMNNMMSRVPNTIDKRQGSVIYNALAPAAVELQNMYINLDVILNEGFANTASREFLIKRAAERGLAPYEATKATVKAQVVPVTAVLPVGARFSLDDLNYIVTGQYYMSDLPVEGQYILECETPGAAANYNLGDLVPIDYIEDLQRAEIVQILTPGEDEEGTDEFRQRYFESFDKQAYGGNITDYRQKTKKINGVGGVKVYPIWNGGGTVKLVIIDSTFSKPSTDLVNQVQTLIDPVQNQGEGLGIAPIGHVVTVEAVGEETINIVSNITLEDGYIWADVEANARQVINDYFLELNTDWENQNNIIVRISQIETHLLNVSGIIDVADTELNELAANYQAQPNNIVLLGSLSSLE